MQLDYAEQACRKNLKERCLPAVFLLIVDREYPGTMVSLKYKFPLLLRSLLKDN